MELKLGRGFQGRIVGAFGDSGGAWLDALPGLVESCAQRWSLSRIEPFPALSYAWVARVLGSDGEAVLKISVPGIESRSEILALEAFPADLVCRLYETDPDVCAILIEDLIPGATLHTVTSFEARVEIARRIFARLHDTANPSRQLPDLSAFLHFATVASRALGSAATRLRWETSDDGDWRPRLHSAVRNAVEQLERRVTASARDTLIHGDLHHGNILRSADDWKLIDPKGIAGPLWLEPARFMLNQFSDAPSDKRRSQFDRMAESFARALGVRPDLVALGAVLDAAVSACWSREDGAGEQEMMQAVERAETIGAFAGRWIN